MRKTCLNAVYDLAKSDERVVFIGSDLGPGTLDNFREEMPDRFFMEGISEQNVIGMAAGLAMEGYIPFVNTIATFITRRCYEQVAMDLCLHNLPVRLIGNGGGMVYAPLGPTHLAIEDIAIMRALPNMTIVAPSDAEEMERFVPKTLELPGPVYIRLGKGGDPVVSKPEHGFEIGRSIMLRPIGDVLIVSTGVMTKRALDAASRLADDGIDCGVMHMHTVKPLDGEALRVAARKVKVIVTIEEHTINGGLGSAITDCLVDTLGSPLPMIRRLGIPDTFTNEYGSQDSMLETFGLTVAGIEKVLLETKSHMSAV
jgi:transketolase